jgi:hypothetical protein
MKPVRLRPAHLGRPVLDLLELEEQLIGLLVRPAADRIGWTKP